MTTYDLASLGWGAALAAAYTEFASGSADQQPGRVVRADRGVCTVLTGAGPVRASLAGAVLTAAGDDPAGLPCAGDWVVLRTWPDGPTTAEAVLPRRTAVIRRTAGRAATGQLLAANLDTAAVVEPIDPSPDLGRVERLLALAWQSGARPLVVLTKADLAADPVTVAAQVADATLVGAAGGLRETGVPVLPVSAERGHGIEALRDYVPPGQTLGLLGPSGAGKSTLVNALARTTVMVTQRVRRADGKGRHTTTYRALIPLPGGGAVLDTPGLRAVGLLDGVDGLDDAFADLAALAAACRFADCRHDTEPDCAVREAIESGELSHRRWESWRKLQRELASEQRRQQARAGVRERAHWRALREARHRARP
jgi:ribosome biogenesis GTPase